MTITPDPDLMRIFRFMHLDLDANRSQKITEFQSQRLLKSAKQKKSFLIFNGIAYFILLSGMILLFVFINPLSSLKAALIIFLFEIVILGLSAWVIIEALKGEKNMISDLESRIAYCKHGTIKIHSDRNGGYLYIANITLRLDLAEIIDLKKYLKKVPEATQFRVYYIPKSKRVLSMEIIDS